MMQAQQAELEEKWARVRTLLEEEGAQALLLNQRPDIAWFTGGADVHVARDEAPVAALLITAEKVFILTTEIEAARLQREEFAPVAGSTIWQINARPWTRTLEEQLETIVSGRAVLTDDPAFAAAAAAAGNTLWKYRPEKIAALRYPLTPAEVERYRQGGRLVARALEEAARAVRRGQSELEIAADLDRRLQERGLEPTVTLVAADDRIRLFRHPIPTGTRVLSRCMLVTCARYFGLTIAATRLVQLGRLPVDLERRHQAVLQVEAAMLAASRPGVTMAEVYQTAVQAYAAQGFPGEERLHHQGGTIGYRNRDYRAEPGSTLRIHAWQAVAWNPSITGTKTEDTFLVTESGLELLSAGETGWPMINVNVNGVQIPRPAILQL
ncbi:MAG: M24 family metallopeptidase [Limnochordales bacterium]|nr:M24 family metallopeptidase [Limnochordales bacterium]